MVHFTICSDLMFSVLVTHTKITTINKEGGGKLLEVRCVYEIDCGDVFVGICFPPNSPNYIH